MKSKDKIVNKDGECILKMIEERGWHNANGNMRIDAEGEYTYTRPKVQQ